MRVASLLLLLLWPLSAAAEDLPALFAVDGVSFDDTLNVREKPDAQSAVVAKLAPDLADIEVTGLSKDGSWAEITTGERPGWVAFRFLRRQEQAPWHDAATPLYCFGTEPFWGFDVIDGSATFDSPEGKEDPEAVGFRSTIQNRGPEEGDVALGIGLGSGFAVVRNRSCSDGMSDQSFGLAIELFRSRDGDETGYAGCCTLNP